MRIRTFITAFSAILASAVGVYLMAQAPQASGPAKGPALTPDQAVAPAGTSRSAENQKGKGKGRGFAAPTGPTPRLPDGHVDLSGVWNGGGPVGDLAQGLTPGESIPLSDVGRKKFESQLSKDDPEANCLPTGVPRMAPYPWRIVQIPTHIYFIFEGNIHSYRQIFMDGRKHPADPNPTWYGHSIGSWDGDTLVIDTIGYNDRFWFDFRGHPHSEKLHTIERWTRKDLGTLENKITIDDPVMYSKPFTLTFNARLRPGEDLMEYICQENQQDTQHLQGPARP